MAQQTPVKLYQTIARLSEFGEWESVSSLELEQKFDEYIPAGGVVQYLPTSHAAYKELVLERAYQPEIDNKVIDWVEKFRRRLESGRSMSLVVLGDEGTVRSSKSIKVSPAGYKLPEGKSGGSALAMFSLKLNVHESL